MTSNEWGTVVEIIDSGRLEGQSIGIRHLNMAKATTTQELCMRVRFRQMRLTKEEWLALGGDGRRFG